MCHSVLDQYPPKHPCTSVGNPQWLQCCPCQPTRWFSMPLNVAMLSMNTAWKLQIWTGTKFVNGLWYIGDWLLIPCVGDICEKLFWLAHNSLGHFSADKSYAMLHNAYYWPIRSVIWKRPTSLHVWIASAKNHKQQRHTVWCRKGASTQVFQSRQLLMG